MDDFEIREIKLSDTNGIKSISEEDLGYKCSVSLVEEKIKSLNKNRESNIWQRRYWEHTILSEYDLYRHIDYIHYNSVKHFNIAPKDWEYSSFKKYVSNGYYSLDWCNLEDKYEINNLSFE